MLSRTTSLLSPPSTPASFVSLSLLVPLLVGLSVDDNVACVLLSRLSPCRTPPSSSSSLSLLLLWLLLLLLFLLFLLLLSVRSLLSLLLLFLLLLWLLLLLLLSLLLSLFVLSFVLSPKESLSFLRHLVASVALPSIVVRSVLVRRVVYPRRGREDKGVLSHVGFGAVRQSHVRSTVNDGREGRPLRSLRLWFAE